LRRILIVLACAGIVGLVLAASVPEVPTSSSELSINTRVAILENRMDRIQTSVDDLRTVPSQLARIEEQIRSLGKTGDTNSTSIQEGVKLLLSASLGIAGTLLITRWKNQ